MLSVKKFVVICLLLIYGSSSFGMTVYFHYCCGKLKNIDLISAKNLCTMGKAHKMGDKPCCESKKVNLKVSDDQAFVKTASSICDPHLLTHYQLRNFDVAAHEMLLRIPEIFSPPPLLIDLNILHCVYRI